MGSLKVETTSHCWFPFSLHSLHLSVGRYAGDRTDLTLVIDSFLELAFGLLISSQDTYLRYFHPEVSECSSKKSKEQACDCGFLRECLVLTVSGGNRVLASLLVPSSPSSSIPFYLETKLGDYTSPDFINTDNGYL